MGKATVLFEEVSKLDRESMKSFFTVLADMLPVMDRLFSPEVEHDDLVKRLLQGEVNKSLDRMDELVG